MNVVGAIALAVYRPEPSHLRRQVESIKRQTLADWECHIGIDGRDEDARLAVEALIAGDPRFRIHAYEENVGFYRNFERLLEEVQTSAKWVALSDQDDYWYPEKLATLDRYFDDEEVTVASAQARLVDGVGEPLGTTSRRDTGLTGLIIDNQVTGSFCAFRLDVIATALPFPEPTDAAYHDHWLGLVGRIAGRIQFSENPLQDYVQHGSNVIGEHNAQSARRRGASLRGRSGSIASIPSYLRVHRWGWRARMAKAALARTKPAPGDFDVLRTFAKDRISLNLALLLSGAVLRRSAPIGRTVALLVGSAVRRR